MSQSLVSGFRCAEQLLLLTRSHFPPTKENQKKLGAVLPHTLPPHYNNNQETTFISSKILAVDGSFYYNMDIKPKVKLIHLLQEAMLEAPPVTQYALDNATLKDLRPSSITQVDVANFLGERGSATISRWESGKGLDGIKPQEIQKLGILYKRNPLEILAAIENTRLLTKEEN